MDDGNTRIGQALRSLAVMAPVVFAIGGVVTTGCGSDGKDTESPAPPDGSLQRVDASGGTFEFPNGVVLEVPAGAVAEPTMLHVSDLPAGQVDAILLARTYAFHDKRYLGGFSVEPDVEFQVPIKAIVPILPLEPREVPLRMEIDFDEDTYWIAETHLSVFPDRGVAEIEVSHFSDVIVGALDGIDPRLLDELCTDPLWNPLLAICEDFDDLQPAYCLLKPADRPADAVCCKEQTMDIQAQAAEFSLNRASGECEIVFDNVQVTFRECTLPNGSPAPPQTNALGEVSPNCPEGTTFEIDVEPSTLNLFACEEESLEASITGTAPDGKVLFQGVEFPPMWDTSTPDVVDVAIDGTVTGLAEGTTQVLALVSENSAIPPGEALVNVRSNIRSFSVSPPAVTLKVGEERLLEAKPVDSDGNLFDASDVTWSSDDPSIASLLVDTGQLTSVEGVAAGATQATATFEYECETATATADITVDCAPVTFSVSPSQVDMEVGEERLLEAVAQDEDGNPLDVSGVQWSSGAPDVADLLVDTGQFTSVEGVSEGGPVAITATYEDGCQTKPATASVTVGCPMVVFSVDPAAVTMQVGEERLLEAVAEDEEGNPLDVSGVQWSSGAPDVADLLVDTGQFTSVEGVSEGGPVAVTATYDDGCQKIEKAAQVTVTPAVIVEITSPANACLAKQESLQLAATIKDATGNDWPQQGPVAWRSLAEGVATVDADGLVTASTGGPVTIEASYEEDGEVYTGSIALQVLDLSGSWNVTEVADETGCDEGVNMYTRTVDAEHTGNTVSFQWSGGWASGTKNGCTIGGYGGESEDGGYTFAGGSLTIAADGSTLTGSTSWQWNGTDPDTGEPISCSGSSGLTARR